jgi:hypothetical protein
MIDHDLGAEGVEVGAAPREGAGIVVDDADLELLGLREKAIRSEHRARHEDRRDEAGCEASPST